MVQEDRAMFGKPLIIQLTIPNSYTKTNSLQPGDDYNIELFPVQKDIKEVSSNIDSTLGLVSQKKFDPNPLISVELLELLFQEKMNELPVGKRIAAIN